VLHKTWEHWRLCARIVHIESGNGPTAGRLEVGSQNNTYAMKSASLKLVAIALSAGAALTTASAGTFKHVTIDGAFGDWAGVPLAVSDPADSPSVVDYGDIYVANDEDYLYIRFTIHAAADPFTWLQNIFIDTDNNTATGFAAGGGGHVGSEMLIQSGAGYQEKSGSFNAGAINGLGWSSAPAGAGTQFEARISRHATNASDNSPVFTSDTIALVFESDNASFTPTEWAPDTGGIVYTFESAPSVLTTNLPLLDLATSFWRVNDAGTDLGSIWLNQDYDDFQSGWNPGPGLFGYTTTPGAYPAINTVLASGRNTYYFRTHFNWNHETANVILVATNYLSDGAVYYLNGTEMRRVRMPSGAIAFATPATGVASPVGKTEVFGISPLPLLIGDNILEVETHQTAGSAADMVLGVSLTAAAQFALLDVNPSLPADASVVAGQSLTLTADVIGSGPISYQWLKNGAALAGATDATLTIPMVLTNDAGGYALRTSNPLSTNVTRTATVTVTSTPVAFVDPTQPADTFAVEGKPVTLSVTVSGSPLLSYQWFKDASPIPDATNAAFIVTWLTMADAGSYRVMVSNPSGTTNSRTAALTVLRDAVPPTVTQFTPGASQIVVHFSEPLNPATANAAGNYTLSGGINISSAVLAPADATRVTLTTSAPLAFGTIYSLTIKGVSDLFGNVIRTTVSGTRVITIDGAFDDWQGIAPSYTGPANADGAADFAEVYVSNDADNYYFRTTLWHDIPSADGQFPFYVNMFFDTDNDVNTGYLPATIGSELLVQSGYSYQQKNGGFNEGSINNLNWLSLPAAPGTNFEFKVARAATFNSDGSPVFPTNVLNFVFQGMTPGFIPRNRAPASGVISYTNTPALIVPPLPLSQIAIQRLPGGQAALTWDLAATLQANASITSGTWTNVPNATSPYVIPISSAVRFFRLAQ